MIGRVSMALVLMVIVAGAFALGPARDGLVGRPTAADGPARRIVSLAPSVTETLFALGLGDRVVGITRFCVYPPEVETKVRVGGLFDPNFEAIVALKPDLVVLLANDDATEATLGALDIRTLTVDHRDIEGILDSIELLGRAGGVERTAAMMVGDLRRRMDRVRAKTAGQPRRRVLLAISRALGTDAIEDVYVAGDSPYFNRVLDLAGGQSVFLEEKTAFPVVSAEGILYANPDVIVDLVPNVSHEMQDADTLLDDWRQLAEAAAVRQGRVYLLEDDFAAVPGPRFILLVEKLAQVLHPEVDWSRRGE